MYEAELGMFVVVWVASIFIYLEWCRRNRYKWVINPLNAVLVWFAIGFSVEGYVVWVNGYIESAVGHIGMVLIFLVIPFILRLFPISNQTVREN